MKANELRIGNIITGVYYYALHDKREREQIIVEAITSTGVNLEYGDTMYIDIQPIPLTEERLIKFGLFNIDGTGQAFMIGGIIIEKRKRTETFEDFFIYKHNGLVTILEFVHTFQNLHFALTGRELNIQT